MKHKTAVLLVAFAFLVTCIHAFSQTPKFKVIAFYSTNVEGDHVQFARDAVRYFSTLARKDGFSFDSTTEWNNLNAGYLKPYRLVLWLDDSPHMEKQRLAFRKYMEAGGAWMGFHFGGYNDATTHWPWFVNFLGGAVFYGNSWPLLPARLRVDDDTHPVTRDLPQSFISPPNEWYVWKPNPRNDKDVRVLVTLDPSNYPLGIHDIILRGDVPVVWTNTKYKMIYMNMGHGDKIFDSPVQNRLIENATLWLGRSARNVPATPTDVERPAHN